MIITIRYTVYDGNLGEGWEDPRDAAYGLASYIRHHWERQMVPFEAAGHDVDLRVRVQERTEGINSKPRITVDGDNWEKARDLEDTVRDTLTDTNTLWGRFCQDIESADL